jgi:signal transduction histidine kinase/CheY-like chemotaxis protein
LALSNQVSKSIDEELAQSKARFIICSILSAGAVFYDAGSIFDIGETLPKGLILLVFAIVFSSNWYMMVRRHPGRRPWRKNISLVADLGLMAMFLETGGQQTAWSYPIFLWIIIGNGIRFGEKMMIKGIMVGILGFGWALNSNAYWQANLEVGLGLLVSVVILPFFFLGVLRRLQAMHELRLELAQSKLADKAKDQFLAAMSHELRTPMNGVLGMAETLSTTELKAEQRNHLQVITRSVESLLFVINDILDYSKITAGVMNLESVPFDLEQILEDVCQLMDKTARDKGIDLNLSFPKDGQKFFLGDPTRLRQIVFNLVGNAIKFTERGSVMVECRIASKSDKSKVTLVVADTGIGIPEDRFDAIFGHFVQADSSTTRRYGGTGLGLAISKKLVGLMDGQIELKSTLGEGSTFTVQLDLCRGNEPAPEKTVIARDLPNFDLTALVVEDNKFNQVVIQNILKRIGVVSELAENGACALDMLDEGDYDLIFMDVRMPVMDGYDATRAIRKIEGVKGRIPIVALTGEATNEAVQKCLESGMDLHLAKPIQLDKIIGALEVLSEIDSKIKIP